MQKIFNTLYRPAQYGHMKDKSTRWSYEAERDDVEDDNNIHSFDAFSDGKNLEYKVNAS